MGDRLGIPSVVSFLLSSFIFIFIHFLHREIFYCEILIIVFENISLQLWSIILNQHWAYDDSLEKIVHILGWIRSFRTMQFLLSTHQVSLLEPLSTIIAADAVYRSVSCTQCNQKDGWVWLLISLTPTPTPWSDCRSVDLKDILRIMFRDVRCEWEIWWSSSAVKSFDEKRFRILNLVLSLTENGGMGSMWNACDSYPIDRQNNCVSPDKPIREASSRMNTSCSLPRTSCGFDCAFSLRRIIADVDRARTVRSVFISALPLPDISSSQWAIHQMKAKRTFGVQ